MCQDSWHTVFLALYYLMLPILFAPIQGYTDATYRNAHRAVFGGVTSYYTPFLRIEHGDVRARDMRDIACQNNEHGWFVPQIIVKDAEEFRFLVSKLRDNGHRRMDVNMGCPFPMQTRKGRGAGLLSQPEHVQAIMAEINKSDDIEFSVKMRLGNENADDWRALIPLLNEAKLCHVTMHPRIGKQQYKGVTDMEQFQVFLQECRHDVIYNGDILSISDIERIEHDFPKVKGIMIGRGLLMSPWLAKEYTSGIVLDDNDRLALVMRLHDMVLEHYETVLKGEAHLLMKMKTFWEYLEGVIGHKCYKSIKKAVSMAKYKAALPE